MFKTSAQACANALEVRMLKWQKIPEGDRRAFVSPTGETLLLLIFAI